MKLQPRVNGEVTWRVIVLDLWWDNRIELQQDRALFSSSVVALFSAKVLDERARRAGIWTKNVNAIPLSINIAVIALDAVEKSATRDKQWNLKPNGQQAAKRPYSISFPSELADKGIVIQWRMGNDSLSVMIEVSYAISAENKNIVGPDHVKGPKRTK